MIFSKLWRAFAAQLNKVANFFYTSDPVAQMQYEYDRCVEQMKEGRQGLEQYAALVERVKRQVDADKKQVAGIEAKVKSFLAAGKREMAAKFALDLQKAKAELAENSAQLQMHQQAYENNVLKIKHATGKLNDLKAKIGNYQADLKMSRAEAELANVASAMKFDVTTDFGQAEQVIQDQIGANRAKARVAADLSTDGLETVQQEMETEQALADQALREFEMSLGTATPETSPPTAAKARELGTG